MFSGPGAFWRQPRRPMAGVAVAGVSGILLAEAVRRWLPSAMPNPWGLAAVFLTLSAAFCVWPRKRVFWPLLVVGFATLHGFYSAPVAALRLAELLPAADGSGDRRVIRGEGTVLDVPRDSTVAVTLTKEQKREEGPTWRFTLALDRAEVEGIEWRSRARLSVTWRNGPPVLAAGTRLAFNGTAANLAPPRNPGEFDLAGWRRRHDICSEARLQGLAAADVLPGSTIFWDDLTARVTALAARVRGWMTACLARDLEDSPEVRAVTATMLLGLHGDPGLGDDLEALCQRTGTLHYFAVDGLKLGLMAALCLRVLEFTGVSRALVNRWILPLLLGYATAAGLGPASLRAVFIAAVVVGGTWIDRPARPSNALGAAAAGLLLWDTRSLFDLGFQLTFFVVLSILVLARPLAEWLKGWGAPDPFVPRELYSSLRRAWEWPRRGALDLTAVGVAAWLGSLPVMLWAFGWFSPISPLANVLTFPLAFTVLTLGVLSVAGGVLSAMWSIWMNNANWLAAKGFLFVVRVCDAVPYGSLHLGDPNLWRWPPPLAEITVLDTSGQGYATYVSAGRHADWLIDCPRASAYARVVRPYLRARAVERLGGGLILTEADARHLGSAPLVITEFAPWSLSESPPPSARSPAVRALREMLAARGGPPEQFFHQGDTIELGPGVRASVLSPETESHPGKTSAATRALTLRIDAGGWRVLLLPAGSAPPPATVDPGEWRSDAIIGEDLPWTGYSATAGSAWLIRPRGDSQEATGAPSQPATFDQRDSGAVTLSFYANRLEARGFLSARTVIKARPPDSK